MWLHAAIPFTLLIVFNLLIIYKATSYNRAQNVRLAAAAGSSVANTDTGAKRKQEMTRTILITTFSLVIFTMPSALLTAFFYKTVIALEAGQMLVNLIDDIHFTFPAFNFFILYWTNKLFAKEIKTIIQSRRASRVESLTSKNKVNPKINNLQSVGRNVNPTIVTKG